MKILIPIDGSELSMNAVRYAAGQPVLFGDNPEIHIFYAQVPASSRILSVSDPETMDDFYREEAKNVFEDIVAKCGAMPDNVSFDYGIGEPADTIVKAADDFQADFVVMGTHGRGAIDSLLFGSVANEVVHHSHRPILMIRHRIPTVLAMSNIAVAVDDSEQSRRVKAFFESHAGAFAKGTHFTLVHVEDHEGQNTGSANDACGIAAELRRVLEDAGMTVTSTTLYGSAGEKIAEFSEAQGVEMLVMGSHGYGPVTATMVGSTTMKVASHCDTPLLIIR